MTSFFIYLLKSSASLVLFYIMFRLVMRNDKSHKLNRFLLIGILIVSAIIPCLKFSFFLEKPIIEEVEFIREIFIPVTKTAEISSETYRIVPISENSGFHFNFVFVFYLFVITILVIRLAVSVIRIIQLMKKAEKRGFEQFILAVVKDFIQPFTFLKHIFISEKDFNRNNEILIAHELEHIKQKHFIDLFLVEAFTLLFWFNPFMWLLRGELKLIHEYQADQAVLKKGIDAKKYQLLVLEKAVGERRFAMANHFTQKPILKRLKMMKNKNINNWNGLKLILFIPLVIFLLQAFSQPQLIQKAGDWIPSVNQRNESEKWLDMWNSDNIGRGFYQPETSVENLSENPKNILEILMNSKDEFLIEGEFYKNTDIKLIVKDYLHGKNPDGKTGPDFIEKDIPEIGKMKVLNGSIFFKHDIESSPEMIDFTLHSIGEACLEIRMEKAKILFNEDYFELDEEKQLAVNMALPVWFSYDFPKPPDPSIWLPFDKKPSSYPEPINIVMKNDGSITAGDYKYKSLEEFNNHLKEWRTQRENFSKNKKSKGFYRAYLTVEPDVSESDYDKICKLFYYEEIHLEHITRKSNPEKFPLENVKLEKQILKVLEKTDSVNVNIE